MSTQTITKSSFALMSLNESAYELKIQFSDKQGSPLSNKTFTFIEQPSVKQGEILDIYSQNGVCNKPLFTRSDVKGIQKAVCKLQLGAPIGPTALVLDLKDLKKGYLDQSDIAKHEEMVCDFFQHGNANPFISKHARKIHLLFQSKYPLDFVICEGSLKNDLLKKFSESEAEYFQYTSDGAISFCQCAEFFMNGFKLGQGVSEILADKYIRSISKKVFQPYEKSTIWYPALYKDVYSPEGTFAQALKPVFSVTGSFDEGTEITKLSVEMRA